MASTGLAESTGVYRILPGSCDTALVALERLDEVVAVAPDGSWIPVLTAQNGVVDPTSLAVRGTSVYVDNAAYFGGNPNLTIAKFDAA